MKRVMKITAKNEQLKLRVTIELNTVPGLLARSESDAIMVALGSAVMHHIEDARFVRVPIVKQRVRP